MPDYTSFRLKSGAVVQVESSRTPPEPSPSAGPVEASTGSDRIAATWADGARLVAKVGEEVVAAMREAFTGVDEVTVEFGANISGKTGVILVEGSVAANLKVVVKWKKPKRTEG